MTFWSLTNSDFPTNQIFHQFHYLYTELDLHRLWVVSMEHLQRVWHASRERLPFRTPGSVVPHCGTCLRSNCLDQIPRTCHVLLDFSTRIPLGTFSILLYQICWTLFSIRITVSTRFKIETSCKAVVNHNITEGNSDYSGLPYMMSSDSQTRTR